MNTKERIEEQALLLFSRQGYHETSVNEIAEAADVNEGTIFRLFNSKKELFRAVVEKAASDSDINLMDLQLSLSMEDLRVDLAKIVLESFRIYFEKLHIIRLSVAGMIQFEELREFGYLIIPALENFFKTYLNEMEARRIIQVKDLDITANLFLSTLFYDVVQFTVLEKIEQFDKALAERIEVTWKPRIEFFIANMIEVIDPHIYNQLQS
ncbi:MAG: TetR/AcrR family transcriptional regulator [Anaerolineaceae bacterium]